MAASQAALFRWLFRSPLAAAHLGTSGSEAAWRDIYLRKIGLLLSQIRTIIHPVKEPLERGLEALGDVLEDEGLQADLVLVGAGALLLRGEIVRPTADLDVVARVDNGVLQASQPLPEPLVRAVRRVGAALDLPHVPRDGKDWLNPGPSYLTTMGLPDGFENRLSVQTYKALTIRIPARIDLIALKFFAASDPQRGLRRSVDVADIRVLEPTDDEIVHALRWCMRVDGRPDFLELEAAPLLRQLGIDATPLLRELEMNWG